MYELLNRNEEVTKNIIHSTSDIDKQIAGVLVGNNNGKVWVDSLENPVSAVVWSDGVQGFQFMGSATNELFNNQLKAFIEGTLFSFLSEKNRSYFEFACDIEEWYPIILDAFSDRKTYESWQYIFRSKDNVYKNGKTVLPKSYCLHEIDANFLHSIKYNGLVSNSAFLLDYIKDFWNTMEQFLNLGYGYVATCGDKIVSFSITSFLYKETFAIGIETLEPHRRNGLAGSLTKMLIKSLFLKGYHIWWDCMESNIASQMTAKSAGLVFDHKYRLCGFDI